MSQPVGDLVIDLSLDAVRFDEQMSRVRRHFSGLDNGPAVADEFDNPTTDIRKDRCSKCMRGCEMRGMVANFGGFLSINKLSQ